MIVILAGLPGAGKSTLARALAEQTSGIVFDKDQIRAALFPPAEIEHSSAQDDFCIQVALDAAAYIFGKDPNRFVFIDGRPFSKIYQLQQVLQAAKTLEQPWHILECICSEATAKERLQEQDQNHPAADRDYALYMRIKSAWEEILLPKTVINTDQPLDLCITLALRAISA